MLKLTLFTINIIKMAVSFNISELRALAQQLSSDLKMPFEYMTHSFFKRRMNLFLDKNGIRKVEQLHQLLQDKNEADEFCRFFSIATTELFRDPSFWRQLRKILNEKYSTSNINIWLPDGASGEELYSLLILLDEIKLLSKVNVWVNHWSSKAIDNLQNGHLQMRKHDVNAYNYKRFEGVKSIDSYFTELENEVHLNTALMHQVHFTQGGVKQKPTVKCDIVILRNSLIYYTKDYHEEVKNEIDKALLPGGYVCFGVKEQLAAPYQNRFEIIDTKEKIYSKFSFLKGE